MKFNMNKMMDRFFRSVDNVVWDMMSGRVGFKTAEGICSIELGELTEDKASAPEAQVSINPFDDFGMAVPAFAQSIPADQISLGDMIFSSTTNRVLGWVVEKNEKGGFRLMRQDGTSGAWKPAKVAMLGFDSGVMVLRSLMNMLPNGQQGLGQMQGMLMPMMMTGMLDGDGDDTMKNMIPMMLMSQLGLGGADPAAGGAMMSQMMNMMMMQNMMSKMGGSSNSGKSGAPFFQGRSS
jgi:hypothetical protein